jgi:alpha-L-fucosidase
MSKRIIFISILIAMFITMFFNTTTPLLASDPSQITTHAAELEWWKDQRFGMFIHWGPVALRGEEISWSRGNQITKTDYDNLYKSFNPTGFNASQWVQIAKDAGMNYMVFTSKHHDGFCEFNSALTQYKITAPACPFGRDVTKELATACNNAGMGWGIYYSPTDWYVDDYPSSVAPLTLGTYYSNQVVDELLTNYGRVDTVWFDLGGISGVDGATLLNRMRQKQPWVLVNNRGNMGSLGDYATPEQTVGTYDPVNPWESCMTIDGQNQWAWNPDGGVKSLKTLIDMIVDCACGGGNCLLNVGPRPDGVIDPPMVSRLQEVGAFMGSYGESIYSTDGGPIPPSTSWGGTTRTGNYVYVHLNKNFTGNVTIPSINATLVSSTCLTGGTPSVVQGTNGISISMASQYINSLDTIIKLQFDYTRPLFTNLALGKTATQSSTGYGGVPGRAVDGNVDGNFNNNSITHTNNDSQAWWQVDLGSVSSITTIQVYNRTDSNMDRLSDYNVYVLDANQSVVWSNHQTTYPNPMTILSVGGINGRYVKVQLTGTNYLSLAEVEVLNWTGGPTATPTPTPTATPTGTPSITAGLAGYWKFNETSGTTASDSSGNNNTGTVSGATWTTSGHNTGALSFDGVNDYVAVNSSSSLNLTKFTVAMWVNLTSLPAANSYYALAVKGADLSENYELLVGYPSAGSIHFPIKWTDGTRSGDSSSTQLTAGAWKHVVVTYDGTNAKVYINAVLDTTKTYGKTPQTNTGQLIIGNETSMTRYFKGKMDEVRIYNRALSQTEVTSLYNYTGN